MVIDLKLSKLKITQYQVLRLRALNLKKNFSQNAVRIEFLRIIS